VGETSMAKCKALTGSAVKGLRLCRLRVRLRLPHWDKAVYMYMHMWQTVAIDPFRDQYQSPHVPIN